MKLEHKFVKYDRSFVKWTPVIIVFAMIVSFSFALTGNYTVITKQCARHNHKRMGILFVYTLVYFILFKYINPLIY